MVPHRRFTGACDQLEVTAGRTRSNPRRRARHCKFEPSRVQPNSPVIPSHRYNGVTAARAGGAGEGRAHSGRGTGSNLGARQLFLPTQEELRVDPVLALGSSCSSLSQVSNSRRLALAASRVCAKPCPRQKATNGSWVPQRSSSRAQNPIQIGPCFLSKQPNSATSAHLLYRRPRPPRRRRRWPHLGGIPDCQRRSVATTEGPREKDQPSGSFIHHPKRSDHRSRIAFGPDRAIGRISSGSGRRRAGRRRASCQIRSSLWPSVNSPCGEFDARRPRWALALNVVSSVQG